MATSTSTLPIAALEAELSRRRPAAYRLRACITALDCRIPDSLRLLLWRNLLGLQRAQLSNSTIQTASLERASKQELENQRVIHADVLRTRAHDPTFKNPDTRAMLEALLSLWCQRKGSRYKQGLNEVLAPFVWLVEDDPATATNPNYTGIIFELFYAFVDKVLPSMFVEEDFLSLQTCHALFHVLLRFHDAELASRFEAANLTPELYSTPWFLTAFSHCADIKVDILMIWDHCLMRNLMQKTNNVPPVFFLQFIGLALLTQSENRAKIFQVETYELPAVVVNLSFGGDVGNASTTRGVLSRAEELLMATPSSFLDIAMEAMQESCSMASSGGRHDEVGCSAKSSVETLTKTTMLQRSNTMLICGKEVAQWLLNRLSSSSDRRDGVRFFFLDVRSAAAFHFQGHFAMSFHVDPILLRDKHQTTLRSSVVGFKDMSQENICLCILASSLDQTKYAEIFAALLCKWDFDRVGQAYFDDIVAQLEDKPEAPSILLRSSKDEAAHAQEVLSNLLRQNGTVPPVQIACKQLSDSPAAPSAARKADSNSLLIAKNLAERGANALVGGISSLLNRVAPRPNLLCPSSWKVDMILRSEEIHQDGIVHFEVQWVGNGTLPKHQQMLITPDFLVFLNAEDDSPNASETFFRVLNKYSLVKLIKVSSRKKEPRMLIITFSREDSEFKVGFLMRDQEQNKFAIGLIKTHFIRITQVDRP